MPKDMESIAEEILKIIGYDGTTAVPIIKIAREMGFKIFQTEMSNSDISGTISIKFKRKNNGEKIIRINSNDELGHRRFVVAHELAHFLFDYDINDKKEYADTYIKNSHKTLKEQIANTFAANLLMPSKTFVLQYDERKDALANIENWAQYFKVQEKAAGKRLLEVVSNGI